MMRFFLSFFFFQVPLFFCLAGHINILSTSYKLDMGFVSSSCRKLFTFFSFLELVTDSSVRPSFGNDYDVSVLIKFHYEYLIN